YQIPYTPPLLNFSLSVPSLLCVLYDHRRRNRSRPPSRRACQHARPESAATIAWIVGASRATGRISFSRLAVARTTHP
ncbi:MAG: hypothetical protein WBL70_05765, partial [Candidatus Acidiferrales bacterium]